jgi:hypothetical protein
MLAVSLEFFLSFEVILFKIGHVHCRPACSEYRISLLSKIQLVWIDSARVWPRNGGRIQNRAYGILVCIYLRFPDVYSSGRWQPYFFHFLELLLVTITWIHFVILWIYFSSLAEQIASCIYQGFLNEIWKLSVDRSSLLEPNILIILRILSIIDFFLIFILNKLSMFYAIK